MALVFALAGAIGVVVTVLALRSGYYRRLSAVYANGPDDEVRDAVASPIDV